MAQCAYCNAETELYFANVPVCIKCGDARSPEQTRARLIRNLEEAALRAEAASQAFEKVMADIPSRIPHPDGVQRIKNASQELAKSRDEMMEAHRLLDDHIKRGES
jgi:hypothetical protein